MTSALKELGVSIEEISQGDFLVGGTGGKFEAPGKTLFIGNSGTTVRFLTAACCFVPEGTDVMLDVLEIPAVTTDSATFLELLALLEAGKHPRVIVADSEVPGAHQRIFMLQDCRLIYGEAGWTLVGRALNAGVEELRIVVSSIVRVDAEGKWPVDSEAASIRIPTAFDERAHSSVG